MSNLRVVLAPRRARLLFLLLALCVVTAAMAPVPGSAITCCSYSYSITYYSDATYTHSIGTCFYNQACSGDDFCFGQTSAYARRSALQCCLNCGT